MCTRNNISFFQQFIFIAQYRTEKKKDQRSLFADRPKEKKKVVQEVVIL